MIIHKSDIEIDVRKIKNGHGEAIIYKLLTKEQLKEKICLFNTIILKSGVSVGKHEHQGDYEIFYILEGGGTFNDNGKEKKVHKGDVTITYSEETHALINDGIDDLIIFALVVIE
ncbi:cupin domain-containing protein [Clostridium sp. DL1XJH146]